MVCLALSRGVGAGGGIDLGPPRKRKNRSTKAHKVKASQKRQVNATTNTPSYERNKHTILWTTLWTCDTTHSPSSEYATTTHLLDMYAPPFTYNIPSWYVRTIYLLDINIPPYYIPFDTLLTNSLWHVDWYPLLIYHEQSILWLSHLLNQYWHIHFVFMHYSHIHFVPPIGTGEASIGAWTRVDQGRDKRWRRRRWRRWRN